MYSWTEEVWKKQDEFILPTKTHTWQGESGRYITMPCVMPNEDVAGVKFISRNVDDVNGLPKRNSNIMLQKISEEGLYAVVDGMWITSMRTGACAYYNATTFAKKEPETLAIYGLGTAARAFMFFWYNLYKKPITVKLMPYKNQVELFTQRFPELHESGLQAENQQSRIKYKIVNSIEELFDSDIVVSCVSFAHSVICENDNVFKKGCNIVPVHTSGFQNCDLFFDKVFVDDIGHVEGYRYFEQFKERMIRITDVTNRVKPGRESDDERTIVYNGGLAIFDIYWAKKILKKYNDQTLDIPMGYPKERFWI
jgi:ornithine cyclodeaminase/alanine dehydrogenase-like protein (mu-crystallin family)